MYNTLGAKLAVSSEYEEQQKILAKKHANIKGLQIILYNPTLKPPISERKDEDSWQDAKIVFFHPNHLDIHEK